MPSQVLRPGYLISHAACPVHALANGGPESTRRNEANANAKGTAGAESALSQSPGRHACCINSPQSPPLCSSRASPAKSINCRARPRQAPLPRRSRALNVFSGNTIHAIARDRATTRAQSAPSIPPLPRLRHRPGGCRSRLVHARLADKAAFICHAPDQRVAPAQGLYITRSVMH